jgi:hypothetical protein
MEQTNTENTEVNIEGSETPTNDSPPSHEISARESGWVPKEEWVAQGKNPDDWRSAKEFQERGELFEEIHKLKDANKKTAAAFKVLVEHHKKVRETALKEAIDKLKAEKREALENHEIERVYELDERIEKVSKEGVDVPAVDLPAVEEGPTPVFKSWHKKNPWYELTGEDEASRYADLVGIKYRKENPNSSELEFLEHVESRVAKRFPEVFENPNSKGVSEVNPRSGPRSTSGSVFKLTEAEETVCKMLVASGEMTREEYIKEVKSVRGQQ